MDRKNIEKRCGSCSGLLFLSACLLAGGILAGCGNKEPEVPKFYNSVEEVTLETIRERMLIETILNETGHYQITSIDESRSDAELGTKTSVCCYVREGDITKISQSAELSADGTYIHAYYSTDPEDQNMYVDTSAETRTSEITADQIDSLLNQRYYEFDETTDQITLAHVGEDGEWTGMYMVVIDRAAASGEADALDAIFDLVIDPVTGYVIHSTAHFFGEEEGYPWLRTTTFDTGDTVTVDESAKEAVLNAEAGKVKYESSEGKVVAFDTVNLQGDPVDDSIMKDAKLVMLNFWEPWCGPCVNEMPDLQLLYENYKDRGLLIIGAYSTIDMDEDAKAIVEDKGIGYPIIKTDEQLGAFPLEFYPTTYFSDSEGNLLTEEGYIGAKSYEEWEAIVLEYLN